MKKVLSLLLVLTLVLGMSVTSFAAPAPTILSGFDENGNREIDLDAQLPGDSYSFPLTTTNITSPAGNLTGKTALTVASVGTNSTGGALIKAAFPKLVSRTRVSKGANAIKKAELDWDATYPLTAGRSGGKNSARIVIEFVKPFKNNNTDGQAFDIWVYPVLDGKAYDYEDFGVHFFGTLKNETVPVDAATNYVDLYTGNIATIDETVRNIEYDLGPDGSDHDIVLVGRGVKGAKYWGVANQDVSETDADYMDEHDIDAVYHLSVLGGLDKVTNNVLINTASKDDYIFDGELKFLGMGNSKTIPFAETYYIADHMIEVAADAEPEEGEDEEVDPLVVPPETGGTVAAPAGIFDNPSTGA